MDNFEFSTTNKFSKYIKLTIIDVNGNYMYNTYIKNIVNKGIEDEVCSQIDSIMIPIGQARRSTRLGDTYD